MNTGVKRQYKEYMRIVLLGLISAGLFYTGYAFADDLGTIAGNITTTFGKVAQLVTAIAYVGGMGFALGAIMKFKAHKDNPQQIPVGTPLALLFIAAALIF